MPALRPVAVKLYGDEVSVLTSVPFTRNSTRCTLTLSVALAARLTLVVPAGNTWLPLGAVKLTTGAVLPPPGPVQAVPLSVNAAGGLLVPANVPLKPTVKVPPLAMLRFQSALLATVTVALFAG